MILGAGTDIVQIPRIKILLDKYGDLFPMRILHKDELAHFYGISDKERKDSYLAKRFAGKEAVAKSLGTGISGGLNFKDIAITNDSKGMPCVFIDKCERLKKFLKYRISVSLSDDYPVAIAFAVSYYNILPKQDC